MVKARNYFQVSAGLLTWDHYRRIGPAWMVFQWMIHEQRRPRDGEADTGLVMNGNPISYEGIGARLHGMPARTVERHVALLEQEGYIRSEYLRGRGTRYFICKPLRWQMGLPRNGESGRKDSADLRSPTPQNCGAVLPISAEANKEQRTKEQKEQSLERRTSKTSLPTNFQISEQVRVWALEKGHMQLEAHFENFVGRAIAKDYRYADWDQAFMNAIREDWAKLKKGAQPNGNQQRTKRDQVNDSIRDAISGASERCEAKGIPY
jgi:hypothetical protein